MAKTKARTVLFKMRNGNTGYQDIPGQKSITFKLTTKFNDERTKLTAIGPHHLPDYVEFSGSISGEVPAADATSVIPWRYMQDLAIKGQIRIQVAQGTYQWVDADIALFAGAAEIVRCEKTLFSDFKISAPVDGIATYSVNLKGCVKPYRSLL